MSITVPASAPRPMLARAAGWTAGLAARPGAALLSVASAAFTLWLGWSLLRWLVLAAVPPWGVAAECATASGACWPFWAEKTRFILFGTYPFDQQWRPALVSAILLGLSAGTGWMAVAGRWPKASALAGLWSAGILASFLLMGGGMFGLAPVDATRWNGLPLLLMLSAIALAIAFPLGILLALARYQTRHRLLRRMASLFVECMRGVPMVTLLFVGVFVLPLTLPKTMVIGPIAAVLVALVLFHAAYLAEDVRSGLLALPAGQHEAASSLGLGFGTTARLVLLPQAIERSMPALVNSTIGAYKDTSLVVVLGLHDLNATAKMAFSDVAWGHQALEAYVFVGAWFLLSCSYLSWVGRRLAARSSGRRR